MPISLDELNRLLTSRENEHFECKEAKNRYDFEELVQYCVALANEGGGVFALGISDKIPRTIVGSKAFPEPERTASSITDRIHLKIIGYDLQHPNGRVVLFEVPSMHKGVPVQYKGAFLMRSGDSLVPMTSDRLKQILEETTLDFSAEICEGALIEDIDPHAIEIFRNLWAKKHGNESLHNLTPEQLLHDAELLVDGKVTNAALILLGTRKALSKFLGHAELIFEYRSSEVSGAAQQRVEFRMGYLLYHEDLWNLVNLRNDIQHFHDGLLVRDIRTFNEIAIREAVQNAVTHRDYRLASSVFVRQYSQKIEIVSPGGFPLGINLDNILQQQNPRNRRIAEALSRCGLVERSGQGVNLMFEESIKESKPKPDFTGTDYSQVFLTLSGSVQDPKFIIFLEQVGQETLRSFTTQDFILLDLISKEQTIPDYLKLRLQRLIEIGVIEVFGKGRGTRHIISRRFYETVGKKGTYTRKRGLDRDTNKALLFKHIKLNSQTGSQLNELQQVLPSLSIHQIRTLLREMKSVGAILCHGRTRSGRWYPKT